MTALTMVKKGVIKVNQPNLHKLTINIKFEV